MLHALGLSHDTWTPLLPDLRKRYQVVAPDLPGHGASARVPAGNEPTPALLAQVIAAGLSERGINRPHVVGNSLGGWLALELAKIGYARSATLIAPAGLWSDRTPTLTAAGLLAMRTLTRRFPGTVRTAANSALLKRVLFAGAVGNPARLPAAAAARIGSDLGSAAQFPEIFRASLDRHFEGGQDIDVPVTVLFGAKDRILGTNARSLLHLPPHTRTFLMPGAGHVPMWDVPELILAHIDSAADRRRN